MEIRQVSNAFIWRRVHSLMGFWLVIYLTLHLLTNSQAALWLGDAGANFIRMANSLEQIPYLPVMETLLIGIPLAVHMIWGIHRALTARNNSGRSDGSKPSLPYGRNRAFHWQRLSSWILFFGIVGHVVQMRFIEHPETIVLNDREWFVTKVSRDDGLDRLAHRLEVRLYDGNMADEMRGILTAKSLGPNQLFAVANTSGTALLLMVRETFKSPWMMGLYTIFVLAAAFHAFNGLWTFLITWGVILSFRSQKAMIPISVVGMSILLIFGLAAIWGSYWMNQYG